MPKNSLNHAFTPQETTQFATVTQQKLPLSALLIEELFAHFVSKVVTPSQFAPGGCNR